MVVEVVKEVVVEVRRWWRWPPVTCSRKAAHFIWCSRLAPTKARA